MSHGTVTAITGDGLETLTDRWSTVHGSARPWAPPATRTVVVAPHPDDESLSSGGLVAFQRRRGREVTVIAVTDGEASYEPDGDAKLAVTRRAEQRSALEVLGVEDGSIRRLELPDSRVCEYELELVERILDVLLPDDLLVATWDHDVHPDHEACGRAALAAAREVRATLVFSLFWTWHHRRPDEVDPRRLLAFELDADSRDAKRRAIRQHASQLHAQTDTAPILDEQTMEPTTWPCEYFVVPSGPPLAEDGS